MRYINRQPCRTGILLSTCFFLMQVCSSQLKEGDVCPDVKFRFQTNSNKGSSNLYELENKSVIIYFWSTQCLSCFYKFPTLTALQNKYNKDLVILMITKEIQATVDAFFKKYRKIKMPEVKMIAGDSSFHSLFPSDGYPYTVWLDKHKKVKYMTGGYNLTEDHIESFLQGDYIEVKNATTRKTFAPLWIMDSSRFVQYTHYYSILTRCMEDRNVGLGEGKKISEESIAVSYNCLTIPEMIEKAYAEGGKYRLNKSYSIEYKIKNPDLFLRPGDENKWDAWNANNLFNYCLVMPAEKKTELYNMMQQDIKRYFGVDVVKERKRIKGWKLVIADSSKKLGSKGGESYDAYNAGGIKDVEELKFVRQPVERVFFLLNLWLGYKYPVVNGIKENVVIDFIVRKTSIERGDVNALRMDLQKSNLNLVETEVEWDVVIVKDVP